MAAWLVLDNFEIGMHGTLKIVNQDARELMSFPAIIEWGQELSRGLLRRLWPIATVACRRGVCTVLTHCNALQHTATHCNTLQHTATRCNSLQHTATHCNTQPTTSLARAAAAAVAHKYCNCTRAATHSNVATVACRRGACMVLTHCNTLKYTVIHCNTLKYTGIPCNTLQHTTTYYNSIRTDP